MGQEPWGRCNLEDTEVGMLEQANQDLCTGTGAYLLHAAAIKSIEAVAATPKGDAMSSRGCCKFLERIL